jgi:long-chain fatty acid transport protein
MGRIKSLPKLSALTILLSQTFFIMPVHAAGFQINEISPSLQGNASAGAAAADNDVSSMYTNPATLSTLIQNQAYIGGSEIIPRIRVNNEAAVHTVNVPGIPATNITAPVLGETSQSSIAKSAFVPDGYVGWRINEKLVVGLSVVAPFGLTTSYDNNSVLRFMADNSEIETIVINPAISYAINQRFSVGGGLQVTYTQANFSNYNGPYTSVPALDAFIASNQPSYVQGSSWGCGYTLGALYKPDELTRLGVGFRSSVLNNIEGNGRQFVSPGGVTPAPSQDFLFNAASTSHASVRTPAVLTLSAARDIQNWTLKGSVQVNFWDSFNQLSVFMPQAFATNSTIQTHWKNTWLGAIGADYRINTHWTVRGGFAYDETPTSDTYRDPRIPDSDRFWLSAGASYRLNKNLSFDGVYTHIFMKNQTVDVTQASGQSATNSVPLEVNTASASFKGHADIVGLAVRYSI